jgi:exonuclease III
MSFHTPNKNQQLKIIYLNCRSYSNYKKTQLSLTLLQQSAQSQPDVICLSECKININMPREEQEKLFFLPNYNHRYFPSRDKSNGGLLFYIHKSINYSHYSQLDIPVQSRTIYSTDIRWIKLNYRSTDSNYFLIGSVYINPEPVANLLIQPVFDSIEQAKLTGIPFLLGGDLNAKHPHWNNIRYNNNNSTANFIGNQLIRSINFNNLYVLNSITDNIQSTHFYNGKCN